VLDEPLSFWGGLDPQTGTIIDHHHPQQGASIGGLVLVMVAGRGSSSSSSVLAEALRAGTGPAAIVLLEADEIIVLGALVAEIVDGRGIPVLQLDGPSHSRIRTGDLVRIDETGGVAVTSPENEATPPKRGRRTVPADPATEVTGLLPRHKGI
jgi:predicted aconitase with swiveling domain